MMMSLITHRRHLTINHYTINHYTLLYPKIVTSPFPPSTRIR